MCHRLRKRKHFRKKNHITKCIIKINYIACARGPESFAERKFILTQRLNRSCYLFSYYQQCHFQLLHYYILKKKITGSRKLFPVVISSMEDLSDDGGLQKYYSFNTDSEEVHAPHMCLVYHFIWSSYVTGE